VLSGKVRWQQVTLFALFALVPAASVSVLGLRAVATTEISAQREVAAMLTAAADRASRTVLRGLDAAEEALARVGDAADASAIEADLQRTLPPFADPIVLAADRRLLAPAPPSPRPPVRDPACDAAAATLAAAASAAEKGPARAHLLASCTEARSAGGRFLWPLVAIDALRDGIGDPGALAAWMEQHAGELSPTERRATLLDVQGTAAIPDAARARITSALTAQRSRTDDLAAELASAEALSAIERAQRSQEVAAWRGATSAGAVRRTPSGNLVGFVVHEASLSGAIAAKLLDHPDDVRAEVLAGPRRAEAARAGKPGAPSASAEITRELVIRVLPQDPGIVARQARRSRFVLGGVGAGSTVFACLLALLLYRRMRDVERSSDLRTDFVSTVSHELRTPIASVRMLAELLEEGRVPPDEQAEVHAALAQEARRLGETVDRLLGFSRMAAGHHKALRSRGNVAAPVIASIDAFEAQAPDAPRVVREIDGSIEVDIDAGQIRLAVDNLLANARKYAPEGGPYTVTVRRDGDGVAIRVKDRGPGIARRDQKRIFLPFERADDRLSRATEGSGIGLALVAHAARAHGGRAWVESEPGRGATFCLWIEATHAKENSP
jgi:signal transduction histidine kinase